MLGFPIAMNLFQNYLHGSTYTISLLLLLVVGLALCFAGRFLIKGLAFVVTGIVVAAIGAAVGTAFLGVLGLFLGAVIGFIAGGFLGMMVVKLGIGIALGYLGYSASTTLVSSATISLIVGVVLFIIGIVLANQLLSVATAVVGGLLLFEAVSALGFGFVLAAGVALAMGALGAAVQLMSESRSKRKTIKTTQPV